jgi:bacterioferritin-associated ferredoxin
VLICHCRAVNERAVNRAIDRGADTIDKVGRACGAGAHCGGCHPEIERLLSERASRLAGAGASHGMVPAFRGWRHA